MGMELKDLFVTAKKAADAAAAAHAGSAEEIRCIDALRVLKSFPVNTQILVETQVGKGLRLLKKHPRKKIQAYAADLIGLWKNIITEEANRKPDSKLNSKGDAKKKPAVVVKSDSDSVLTQDPRSPSSVSSWPPKATSNNAAREKVRKLIWEGLCKVSSEADGSIQEEVKACDTVSVAISVELALFEQWGCSAKGHCRLKYRSIVFNLKDQKNPDFRRKVLLGQIKAERIPSLTTEEMASDDRQRENDLIRIKALFRSEINDEEEATTDQFKCPCCGERKTIYRQMQTRSADEPMTTFVKCCSCQFRWKFC